MKALLERKILHSILDTVDDGVVIISPTGILLRFNQAPEKMFGYKADEVERKNVSMLMPYEHAIQHDKYLTNFLETWKSPRI
jgi:PAS domain S-box-containing protein